MPSLALIFFMMASGVAPTSNADVDQVVDHLIPVNENELPAYQAQLRAKLFVTPADIARMIVSPAWQPEFAISVYSNAPTSAAHVTTYTVTVTRASANIWSASEPVQTIRCDAELPAPAALLVKKVWKQKLLAARSYDSPIDPPVDGAIVEFALSEPDKSPLRAELPINPAGDILAFQNLGTLLANYCEGPGDQRNLLAKEIEKNATSLLKKKGDLKASAIKESMRISSNLPPTRTFALVSNAAKARLGSSIDDCRSIWGSPSHEETLGRTANLKWNDLAKSLIPDISAVEIAFLDGIACEIALRSKQRITRQKLAKLAKLFLPAFRNADFARPLNESGTYKLSDGTLVWANKHQRHYVAVLQGPRCSRNDDVFDREAAQVRPPTSNH